ncbi:hypothetical protein H1R20_g5806, partial [Candolleomyces eurysporus]
MEAVQKAISQVDLNTLESPSRNPEFHRKISLLRKAAQVQPDAPSSPSKEPVSLPVIRYALYNLAFPDFAIEMTPQFLDLLTTVEFYRTLNLNRTSHLFPHFLEDNDHFEPLGQLDPEIEAELAQLTYELTGMRSLFWTIVVNCCQQDLTHRAISHSIAEFWLRFNEYLPFLANAGPSPHKFHHRMSEEEKQMLMETIATGSLPDVIAARGQGRRNQKHSMAAPFQKTMDKLAPMLRLFVNTVCRQAELLDNAIQSV